MGASATRGRPLPLFLVAFALTLALDQLTKALALRALAQHTFLPLVNHWVGLRLVQNAASAFGLVRAPWLPLAGGIFISLVLTIYVARGAVSRHPRLALPLGLLLGGSLGNLLDRLRFGSVTDFIDFRVWPVFNMADAAITAGVILLAVLVLRARPRGKRCRVSP